MRVRAPCESGTRRPLSIELINTAIAGRDYQVEAIRTLLEVIEAKRRKFLMVMATGTGKTRTAVALVDVLMRAHWVKRVLFLVDRVALQEQALGAFKEHLPSSPRWPEPGEYAFDRNRRVYVTTYPTMLNLIQAGGARARLVGLSGRSQTARSRRSPVASHALPQGRQSLNGVVEPGRHYRGSRARGGGTGWAGHADRHVPAARGRGGPGALGTEPGTPAASVRAASFRT